MKKTIPILLISVLMLSACDMVSNLLGIQARQKEQSHSTKSVAAEIKQIAVVEADMSPDDDIIMLELDSIEQKLDAAEGQRATLTRERERIQAELAESEFKMEQLKAEVTRLEAAEN